MPVVYQKTKWPWDPSETLQIQMTIGVQWLAIEIETETETETGTEQIDRNMTATRFDV